jgi:hypothetical protein
MGTLQVDIERLSNTTGFAYQIALAGLIARHGRAAVVKALAASFTGNVISIATSPNLGSQQTICLDSKGGF